MNNNLPNDAIALAKGTNAKIKQWYLENIQKGKSSLFVPPLSVPYVKESKEEVMRLWIQALYFKI